MSSLEGGCVAPRPGADQLVREGRARGTTARHAAPLTLAPTNTAGPRAPGTEPRRLSQGEQGSAE